MDNKYLKYILHLYRVQMNIYKHHLLNINKYFGQQYHHSLIIIDYQKRELDFLVFE